MTNSTAPSLKRLTQELSRITKEPLPSYLSSLHPLHDNNLSTWTATLLGPPTTPYATGRWILNISIPPTYPMKPPTIIFITKIIHANIHPVTGVICLDLLGEKWSPANTLVSTLEAVEWLLRYPEPESPLNVDLAALYRMGDWKGVESLVKWGMGEWKADKEEMS